MHGAQGEGTNNLCFKLAGAHRPLINQIDLNLHAPLVQFEQSALRAFPPARFCPTGFVYNDDWRSREGFVSCQFLPFPGGGLGKTGQSGSGFPVG